MVRLALAIARKVLHREAQMDPLLLAGVVRVALDRCRRDAGVTCTPRPTRPKRGRILLAANSNTAKIESSPTTTLNRINACWRPSRQD